MHNTTKYIDALPDIIHSYNNTYHSAVHKEPVDVKKDDAYIKESMLEQYMKAKND